MLQGGCGPVPAGLHLHRRSLLLLGGSSGRMRWVIKSGWVAWCGRVNADGHGLAVAALLRVISTRRNREQAASSNWPWRRQAARVLPSRPRPTALPIRRAGTPSAIKRAWTALARLADSARL